MAVAPGAYEEAVTMREWVDVRGAGTGATVITQSGGDQTDDCTVTGADNCELSFLTVENTGNADGVYTYAKAIVNNSQSPSINQVEVLVTAAGADVAMAIHNTNSAKPWLTDLTIDVSGGDSTNYGIVNYGSGVDPALLRVRITTSGGELAYAIYNSGYSAPTGQFIQVSASGATTTSAGIVSQSYAAPSFSSVSAQAADTTGNFAYGVYAGENAYLTLH